MAEVDANENAALYWLSNIKQRWLLLIDNADDNSISLEKYFPKGNRGHILITTRNPVHKVHGNAGPGFYDFEKLEADEANQLLLRAADQRESHDVTATHFTAKEFTAASSITKALDFLALAIIHAGAAIRQGLCTLETYLPFYEKSWRTISKSRNERDESPTSKIYASWEANYTHLESNPTRAQLDAIELLKTFAFFHRENIQFKILRRAVMNAALEAGQEEENRGESAEPIRIRQARWFRTLKIMYTHGFTSGSPPPLPRLIRDGRDSRETGSDEDYDETPLRYALRELVQCSLISHSKLHDSYSMHPLQHRYARERLSVAEQGIWAEAAATVLSSSILLPPLGVGTDNQDFNRDIIAHLDHVRRCRNSVENTTAKNRSSLWRKWLFPTSSFTRHRALMYAKFSLVYAQCGRWSDAEELQSQVKDYTSTFLGPQHIKSRRVSTFLSDTLWNLGRCEEAANMQKAVLDVCEDCFGPQHLETLKAKQKLGQTLWLQGRYTEAKAIQQGVVDGFMEQLGPDHEHTLKALDNLGRTVMKFWEREDMKYAYSLHLAAVTGMVKIHGPDHVDTLFAKESLARVSVDLGGEHLELAQVLVMEVLEKRKSTLGKEHPYTLLSMANAAVIKSAIGASKEAEALVRSGLEIAERNLGRDHVGTLGGRLILGSVLIQQKRYMDAEEVLVDTTERQKHMHSHRGNYHPDRLGALIELAKCYRLQGKIELSIQTCDEAMDGFEKISTHEHPLAQDLKKARTRLVDHQESIRRGEAGFDDITEPSKGQYRPYYVFG